MTVEWLMRFGPTPSRSSCNIPEKLLRFVHRNASGISEKSDIVMALSIRFISKAHSATVLIAVVGMLLMAGGAGAQEILDVGRVGMLPAEGAAAYRAFLADDFHVEKFTDKQVHRAFALSDAGGWGWRGGAGSVDEAMAAALADCATRAAGPCRVHAVDGDLVVDGQRVAHPVPAVQHGEFTVSPNHYYYGPQGAKGAIVWSHGNAGQAIDWKQSVPAYLRAFSNDGWDVYRFDRDPAYDRLDWAVRKLKDGARALRAAGYHRVIAAGQSRGAWHSIQAAREPGLLDVVIAAAPAMHGNIYQSGGQMLAAVDDFKAIVRGASEAHVPVVLMLFTGDIYDSDPVARGSYTVQQLTATGTPVLLIDRPLGIGGHHGGDTPEFGQRFGACMVHFVDVLPAGATSCPDDGLQANSGK